MDKYINFDITSTEVQKQIDRVEYTKAPLDQSLLKSSMSAKRVQDSRTPDNSNRVTRSGRIYNRQDLQNS